MIFHQVLINSKNYFSKVSSRCNFLPENGILCNNQGTFCRIFEYGHEKKQILVKPKHSSLGSESKIVYKI